MDDKLTADGIILIDKPTDMTSFGVVARIRRVLSSDYGKKIKVGHTGTLDPFASGLMILVIGKECRKAGDYSKLDKVYETTITLGKTSTTGDPEGELTAVSGDKPSKDKIEKALVGFRGKIAQKPSAYSAIKINGERAYKLARVGKEVEMPTRQIEVYELEIIDYSYPELILRANVSSGTYIRTLAEDIGDKLGVGAYCTSLRRTSIDKWNVAEAKILSDFGIQD